MKKIRWGIVGPGAIANKFAKAVKNVDCAKLVAVASRDEVRGREFADKYNIPDVFCGYEQMANSDTVDAVYIATPHPFHKPCAELFLNARKHVLCEKPICINAKDAKKLAECARENNVFLMEAMWTRFLPAINEACHMVESGEIGEVLGISADFCYACPPDVEPKLYQNCMAGGSLLDVGIYGLAFASFFLDEPESITAKAQVKDGVDCHTNIFIKYKSGAIASISSAINLYKPEDAYIYGTDGYIYMPHFYGANEFFVTKGNDKKHISNPAIGDGFEEEIYEVCKCIDSGRTESAIYPMSKSIAILKQMDLVREEIGVKYPSEA